jgi:hypothetical protein
MSKADAQRAMREAKYVARNSSGGPTRREAAAVGQTPTPPAARTAGIESALAAEPAAAVAAPRGECGHKSMNGRTCTRAPGHPEKSHRYS